MPVPLFHDEQEAAAFSRALLTSELGKKLIYLPKTGSTNDLALQAARNYADDGTVFVTDSQTGGRGRRGRKWESPPNLGLLFSIVHRPRLPAVDFGWIPLVAGLACAEAIENHCGIRNVSTKWPNDIVIPQKEAPGWKKLGGILCESSLPSADAVGLEARGFVVIGIGLNVNHRAEDLPEFTRAPATSLALECRKDLGRPALFAAILENCERWLGELGISTADSAKNMAIERMRRWCGPECTMQVESAGQILNGTFGGFDNFGRLQLKQPDSSMISLADAEIISVTSL